MNWVRRSLLAAKKCEARSQLYKVSKLSNPTKRHNHRLNYSNHREMINEEDVKT